MFINGQIITNSHVVNYGVIQVTHYVIWKHIHNRHSACI